MSSKTTKSTIPTLTLNLKKAAQKYNVKYAGGTNGSTPNERKRNLSSRIAEHEKHKPAFVTVSYTYTKNVQKLEDELIAIVMTHDDCWNKNASNCEPTPGYCYILETSLLKFD